MSRRTVWACGRIVGPAVVLAVLVWRLGAQRGLATAVVYGVMVLVASLPGAAVLAVAWLRHTRRPGHTEMLLPEGAAHV